MDLTIEENSGVLTGRDQSKSTSDKKENTDMPVIRIPGVIFEEIPGKHFDSRRILLPVFNGDMGGFVARQAKVAAISPIDDVILGDHYHNYRELFTMAEGQAVFLLKDNESGKEEEFVLTPGWRLLIPPGVTHSAKVYAGGVLLGFTEEVYTSPEVNDLKMP